MSLNAGLEMDFSDTFGWLASTFMLATFSSDSQRVMRLLAPGPNLCFIAYGAMSNLMPVVVLQMLLFPINLHKPLARGWTTAAEGNPEWCEGSAQKQ